MIENRYRPSFTSYLKRSGRELPKNPSPDEIASVAIESIDATYNSIPNDPGALQIYSSYFMSRGVLNPEEMAFTLSEGRRNSKTIVLAEIAALTDGACIHVRDPELVEALVHSDIEAVAGDARLPFPRMEISYPEGVEIVPGFQASGMVVAQYDPGFKKLFRNTVEFLTPPAQSTRAAYFCVVRPRTTSGSYEGQECLIQKFDASLDLSVGNQQLDLSAAETGVLRAHVRLAWALFLYLQTAEASRAMAPEPGRHDIQGLPAPVARSAKRQPHYAVVDILRPIRPRHEPSGGHHASPETHWRVGHMRVLRDERFSRNPDNSIRSIWVRPTKVMGCSGSTAVSARAVGPAPS